ncbi:hypothetical protein DTO96_102402 [Ephemeroptericola cinctiostellae]|uniref:Uncharacterized protein n=1 Tax=Ephemeroptericola cinctiostellae TaxID=2268024 RepID=A0A345DE59_9BURK|nr:hypothetical protein [Ephemeroptericola cinctiostellae]AXF86647.1 hypothetical protein DTO96_102402 [Ephemeroptericola cinctiostellae]
MNWLLKYVDKINARILGDDLVVDGVVIKGYFYKSVSAPEYGLQPTELVEFYCDVFKRDVSGLPCQGVTYDGSCFDVVRQGEADELTMLRLHLSPAQLKQAHKSAGI